MDVGEIVLGRRIGLGVPAIEMGGAGERAPRHVLAELQHDEGGELVGGVLLAPEQRDLQMSNTACATSCSTTWMNGPTMASSRVTSGVFCFGARSSIQATYS